MILHCGVCGVGSVGLRSCDWGSLILEESVAVVVFDSVVDFGPGQQAVAVAVEILNLIPGLFSSAARDEFLFGEEAGFVGVAQSEDFIGILTPALGTEGLLALHVILNEALHH